MENKGLDIGKVGTLEKPADVLTKFSTNDALSKHAQGRSLSLTPGKSSADKAAEALARLSTLETWLRVFTKNVAIAIVRMARLTRVTRRVCPDPLAMTRKVAVEPNRASLREYWQM